jgi:hypothetical protein
MRTLFMLVVGGMAFLLACPAALRAEERTDVPPVAHWVASLGSTDVLEREEAMRALDRIGVLALPALRAAAQSPDIEVRRRAADLVDRLERREESTRLLTARRVHLLYRNTPVPDALADFAAKTGYTLELAGNRAKLDARSVTLDTGLVTFWEAFDQFCRAAGVVEPALVPDGNDRLNRPAVQNPYGGWNSPYGYYGGYVDTSRLTLIDGKAPVLPTFLAGALRIRALPAHVPLPSQWLSTGEKVLPLEVAAEPGIQWHGVIGLRVTRAVDDQGQRLVQLESYSGEAMDPSMGGFGMVQMWDPYGNPVPTQLLDPRHIPVRIRPGRRPARMITELEGIVSAQAQTPVETLVAVASPLEAAGQTVHGPQGGWLKVLDAGRLPDGRINIHVQVQPPEQDTADAGQGWGGGGMRMLRMGRAVRFWGGVQAAQPVLDLELRSANGQAYQRLDAGSGQQPGWGGMPVVANPGPQEYHLVFQPNPGQAEPAQLVYQGRRTIMVEVPFTLKDVALP